MCTLRVENKSLVSSRRPVFGEFCPGSTSQWEGAAWSKGRRFDGEARDSKIRRSGGKGGPFGRREPRWLATLFGFPILVITVHEFCLIINSKVIHCPSFIIWHFNSGALLTYTNSCPWRGAGERVRGSAAEPTSLAPPTTPGFCDLCAHSHPLLSQPPNPTAPRLFKQACSGVWALAATGCPETVLLRTLKRRDKFWSLNLAQHAFPRPNSRPQRPLSPQQPLLL